MEKDKIIPPILKYISDPVCLVTKDTTILDANSSFYMNFDCESVTSLNAVLSEKDIKQIVKYFHNDHPVTSIDCISNQLSTPAGKYFDVFIAAHYQCDPLADSFLLLLKEKALKSIIEKRTTESHKLETLGMLAGGVSHDINNKLSIILGYAGLASKKAKGNDKLESDLKAVIAAAYEATNLVQSLVKFCRSKSGEHSTIKPGVLLKEIVRFAKGVLPATIKVRADIDSNCGYIKTDPVVFNELLTLLLSDMVPVFRGGGEVVVRAAKSQQSEKNGSEKISVFFESHSNSDNLELVLNEFSDLKIEKTEHFSKLIEKLGCSVVTYFPKMGGKTSRVLEFVFDKEPETLKVEHSLSISKAAGNNAHILLVEDEQMLARLQQRALLRAGYSVTIAADGAEGYQIWKNQKDTIDLILTDMTMPGMSGADLARRIFREKPDAIIILCTGYSDQIDETGALEIGIKDYLSKPVSNSALLLAIEKTLLNTTNSQHQ